MKFAIERHRHAPELNRCLILTSRGRVVAERPCPGVATIADLRKAFRPLPRRGIVARVVIKYPADVAARYGLTEVERRGFVASRAEGLAFARNLRATHQGGRLFNGDILPAPAVSVYFSLIG